MTKAKRGRESVYCRSTCPLDLGTWREAAAFFSEAAPLGVIGSFVQELLPDRAAFFRFKHHYILNALDSEILCALAEAMGESRTVELSSSSRRGRALPLRPGKPEALIFELKDERRALERVLLHFSHLEKETKRLDDTRYLVTLRYDRADETEMVIRILSFGPMIRVLEPQRFVEQLRERIHHQCKLAAFLPGSPKEKMINSQTERT